MLPRQARPLSILIAAGIMLSITFAQDSSSQSRERASLEKMRGEIADLRRRTQKMRAEARTAEEQVGALDLELRLHSTELEMAGSVLKYVEAQRLEAEARINQLEPEIARQKQRLSERLAALYRLGEVSYVRLFLSFDPSKNPLEAAGMLRYVITRDARTVEEFQKNRRRLAMQQEELALQEAKVLKAVALVEDRKRAMESTRRQQQSLLAKLRSESSQSERELAELEEKARRLERLLSLLYEKKGPAQAGAAITDYRGALPWPLQGKVVESFGTKRSRRFATVTASNGIRIEAEPGAEARAIFDGTVIYAEWFKGYGNLVILDHGNRVFSLYGNLRPTTFTVGRRISAGDSVGFVAASETVEAGSLYFEIRENNEPADPATWLR